MSNGTARKAWTPDEVEKLRGVIEEFNGKKIPIECYKVLSAEMSRTIAAISTKISEIKVHGAPVQDFDPARLKVAMSYITGCIDGLLRERDQLKHQLRELREIRAAVEKYQDIRRRSS